MSLTRLITLALAFTLLAAAPVAAVRSPFRDVFLAPKRRHAIAAFAGMDFDQRFVDEFHSSETKKPYQRIGLPERTITRLKRRARSSPSCSYVGP